MPAFDGVRDREFADPADVTAQIAAAISTHETTYFHNILARRLTVAQSGGDYTSIASACTAASNLTPSATNHVVIEVAPGTYVENDITIPAYTTIRGSGSFDSRLAPASGGGFIFSDFSVVNDFVVVGGTYGGKVSSTNTAEVQNFKTLGSTTGFLVEDTATFGFNGFAPILATTGLSVTGAGTIRGVTFNCTGCTTDFSSTDTGASIRIDGGEVDANNVSIASGTSDVIFVATNLHTGDNALLCVNELHVGHEDFPRESVFGEGDSNTRGMVVFTNTNQEAGTWADITTNLADDDATSATIFAGVTAGNCVYLGGDRKFFGLKADVTTAMVVGGGGVVAEYYNGSSWVAFNVMVTASDAPYTNRGNVALLTVESIHIRFDVETMDADWATKSLNGTTKYWARYRIASDITTAPAVDQFKLHTNRLEINADGTVEYFGKAAPKRDLFAHFNLLSPLSGSSPSNDTLELATTIDLTRTGNSFTATQRDGKGGAVRLLEGVDTSRKATATVVWFPDSNGAGDVELEMDYVITSIGDTLDGSATPTNLAEIVSVNAQQQVSMTTSFDFDISSAISGQGDTISFSLFRDGTAGNTDDTFASAISIVSFRMEAFFYK